MRLALVVVAGCWSASAPAPPPAPAPVETGRFHVVFTRAGHCDEPAVEHAGRVHACGLEFDARTGTYAGRSQPAIGYLADGRALARDHGSLVGIESREVYKTALSPDGKHLAYIVSVYTPDYHQNIVVRETARWTIEYEVPDPRVEGESIETAIGWLGNRLMVTVASPSCVGKNPCTESRIVEVSRAGVVPFGSNIAARWVAFAADGTAIAIADRTTVRVFSTLAFDTPLATLAFEAEKLAPEQIRALAVTSGGGLIAMTMFDDHGVVLYERRGAGFTLGGTYPRLVGSQLVFSRAGDALFATGVVLAVLRRTRTPPLFDLPALTLDTTGFEAEDCTDEHPSGYYCETDQQLRLRLQSPQVTVAIHVSPIREFAATATLDAWVALMRERFVFMPADIVEHVDLGLRAWQTPRGRQLEYHHQIREACKPVDRFVRFAEVDGWLWRVEIDAPPEAPQAQVDPLLARFIDGWLGAAQARIARKMPVPPGSTTCMTF